MAVSRVRIATLRFAAVIAVFQVHEGVRIFLHLLADTLVVLKVGLQSRMFLQELLVIQQRGILADLFGKFTMAIEKLVEVGEFLSRDIAVLHGLVVVLWI